MTNNNATTLVTYDQRSFTINGKRTLLIMGEIHYARSPRALWPALLDRSVACGLNSVAAYIFWNFHEHKRDQYDFSGDHDLGYFLSLCAERGLFVLLRMGPYDCAEWNYGGYPSWLRDEPGITIRTYNQPYLQRVEKYFRHLCAEVVPYLITNGGSVILAQVENEYNNVAQRYGEDGKRYLSWMAELAGELGIDVPVLMCEGATPGAIETVNGHSISAERVAEFNAKHPELPMIWTELWPAWYNTWGFQQHLRDARNIAWHLLRFVGHGGAGWNYYMWHGGTNFGRTSMYLQTTSYDFDAPLDEYGRITPKGAYLARLHRVFTEQQELLLAGERVRETLDNGDTRISWRLANNSLVIEHDSSGHGRILGNEGCVLFDTAVDYTEIQQHEVASNWEVAAMPGVWDCIREPLPAQRLQGVIYNETPVEQLSLTHDASDYCWYSTKIEVSDNGEQKLEITRGADLLYIYIDGDLVAQTQPPFRENRGAIAVGTDDSAPANDLELIVKDGFRQQFHFMTQPGTHRLDILAVALGLIKGDWQIAASMENERKGIWDEVLLHGQPLLQWEMRPGLLGVECCAVKDSEPMPEIPQTCTWYRSSFDLAAELLVAAADYRLDLLGSGKGRCLVNGHDLGRYWLLNAAGYGADEGWHQRGIDGLSLAPAGQPTQRYYHIPQSWLGTHNEVVIFEEQYNRPTQVRLEVRLQHA